MATIRFQEQVKTAKLVNHCKDSHTLKIARKNQFFSSWLYIIPKVSGPWEPVERARLMIVTKVDSRLMRKTDGRSQTCKMLLNAEVCDRNSRERLDDQNRCSRLMDIHGGHVRYFQDLVACDRLNVARYRNDSVNVDFKLQLFISPSFKFSCRNVDEDTVLIAVPSSQ